ncbi:MAG: undecaprenyl/decaprenyl-phosphate alpha-N-acetylglucosaminyl 1-phosphate transferase, partial [Cyanobacteria bacterium J06648_11]
HRLMRAGLSQRLSVLFVYALTLWMGSLALLLSGSSLGSAFLGGASVFMMAVGWEVWKRVRRFTNMRESSNGKTSMPGSHPAQGASEEMPTRDRPPHT